MRSYTAAKLILSEEKETGFTGRDDDFEGFNNTPLIEDEFVPNVDVRDPLIDMRFSIPNDPATTSHDVQVSDFYGFDNEDLCLIQSNPRVDIS